MGDVIKQKLGIVTATRADTAAGDLLVHTFAIPVLQKTDTSATCMKYHGKGMDFQASRPGEGLQGKQWHEEKATGSEAGGHVTCNLHSGVKETAILGAGMIPVPARSQPLNEVIIGEGISDHSMPREVIDSDTLRCGWI